MKSNFVQEDSRCSLDNGVLLTENSFQKDNNEKKRRTEFPLDECFAKIPRSNSEDSYFQNVPCPSSLLDETVKISAMDFSELDLVDSQPLEANQPTDTVFHFVPLDSPMKTESELASPKESIDAFSSSKDESLSSHSEEKSLFLSSLESPPLQDDQFEVLSSAEAKVIYPTCDSFESKLVAVERTGATTDGTEAVPCTIPTSSLTMPNTLEDCDENEFDNCTTVESSSVSCRSRRSGCLSADRSVPRSEVSVDRFRTQSFSSSFRNRNRSCSRDRADRASSWVSAAPVRSASYKVVPNSSASRVSSSYTSVSASRPSRSAIGKYTHIGGVCRSRERVSNERRSRSKERYPSSHHHHSRNQRVHHHHNHHQQYQHYPHYQQHQVSSGYVARNRSPLRFSAAAAGTASAAAAGPSSSSSERTHYTSGRRSGSDSSDSDSHSRFRRSRTYSATGRAAFTEWSYQGKYVEESSYRHTHTSSSSSSSTSSYSSSSSYSYTRTTHDVPTTRPVVMCAADGKRVLEDLPLEWWERTEDCKEAKARHTDRIDHICDSREDLVLKTTLWKKDTVLEPNMFPYNTPSGVEHHTLWSIYELTHPEIVSYVDGWLGRHMPHVRRWQYDDNSGERSINLFHVHIFIETVPYSFTPRDGMLYLPPHSRPVGGVEAKADI